jgi:hypothetical protein
VSFLCFLFLFFLEGGGGRVNLLIIVGRFGGMGMNPTIVRYEIFSGKKRRNFGEFVWLTC